MEQIFNHPDRSDSLGSMERSPWLFWSLRDTWNDFSDYPHCSMTHGAISLIILIIGPHCFVNCFRPPSLPVRYSEIASSNSQNDLWFHAGGLFHFKNRNSGAGLISPEARSGQASSPTLPLETLVTGVGHTSKTWRLEDCNPICRRRRRPGLRQGCDITCDIIMVVISYVISHVISHMWCHIWYHMQLCDIMPVISYVISWCDVEKWIWYHIWWIFLLPMISHVISQFFGYDIT